MIASEPCYNGTIHNRNFVNKKILWINFRDLAQIAKNAKVKPRKIFPLYGMCENCLQGPLVIAVDSMQSSTAESTASQHCHSWRYFVTLGSIGGECCHLLIDKFYRLIQSHELYRPLCSFDMWLCSWLGDTSQSVESVFNL